MKVTSERLRTIPVARPVPRGDRKSGMPLDLDVIWSLRVNRSAVERRAATIPTRRTVKKEWQAAWLLRAITCMDLTTLQGDDTPTNVLRLCAKARSPVRRDLTEANIHIPIIFITGHGDIPMSVRAMKAEYRHDP